MYGNGGGGHKATAAAITAVLNQLHPTPPAIELVDSTAVSGVSAGDWLYNLLLSYNAVSAIELMHSALSLFWPIALPGLRNSFRTYWAEQPQLCCVVSVVPILNAVFAETLPPWVPLYTVLTDFSHTTSHPWIQHPRQHLIAGTDIAYAQALAMGYLPPDVPGPSQIVTRTTGMVVHPKFYRNVGEEDRKRRRSEMGLDSTLPTVLILFGGAPPTDRVVELVDRFVARQTYSPVNLIVICSTNRALYDKLMKRKATSPTQCMHVTGYSNEIPLFMQMSDVLIGKPGPGVVSEAYVSRLPCVMVTGDSEEHVMKQEKDVLDWVRREGIGMVVRTPSDAAKITQNEITEMKERIACRPGNDAVFQVGEIILNAVGLEIPQTDEGNEEESPGPTEADIGAMNLNPKASGSSRNRTRRQSESKEGQRRTEAGFLKEGTGSRRERRASSLSPTTITAPSSRGEGKRRETLPNSWAVYSLGKSVEKAAHTLRHIA